MDKELEKYYEDRFSMMATQGWKDLLDDVKGMELATNEISGVQDEKTLHFRRGELSILRWILSLKQTSEKVYEDLKNETS
jgi:hypothetical protein